MLEIGDRSKVFYWQTDRNLKVEDFDRYFLKRHEVDPQEIITTLQRGVQTIQGQKDISIIDPDENVLKGNVNIVRKVTINGDTFVARMHPKGVKNGYFYAEKVALDTAYEAGLPVPQILEVHEAVDEHDMDFVLMTASSGITMESAIKQSPELEPELLHQAGALMAKLHQIRVEGFGSFNNETAKQDGKLVGLHRSYHDFIWCGLEENLQRLVSFGVIDANQATKYKEIFEIRNFEPIDGSRLIHNDFADWNLLADDGSISSILDWDESHAGDPIADLACWSTFFDLERFYKFLEGYKTEAGLPEDFEERFHFYRLRYTISKMALRTKRALVDKSDFIREKIKIGEKALVEELEWFERN